MVNLGRKLLKFTIFVLNSRCFDEIFPLKTQKYANVVEHHASTAAMQALPRCEYRRNKELALQILLELADCKGCGV